MWNRHTQSGDQGWGSSCLKYVLLDLTSLELMRFDYYYHTIVTIITLGMSVILLCNVHVTADEAHVNIQLK